MILKVVTTCNSDRMAPKAVCEMNGCHVTNGDRKLPSSNLRTCTSCFLAPFLVINCNSQPARLGGAHTSIATHVADSAECNAIVLLRRPLPSLH